MKTLFKAIRASDFPKVKALIGSDPSLVHCVARQPPKKDDGQSPLQVAFKCGQFDIADFLIDSGADVQFIEKQSINEWRTPVVHDAIRAAIFSSRYLGIAGPAHTLEQFQRALASLEKLVLAGANVRACDSYGNNCLVRAVLDARQLKLDASASKDVGSVFSLLVSRGADIHERTPQRPSAAELAGDEPVAQFLRG
ncbi:MAG: ankyrin repeat domain-containing protein [Planctomycetia bacterium]|nr:ankyrin repeat domain-containing protein [Planctomycetia bacterium]